MTTVARESADVVLRGNDLVKFVETVQIAQRTRRIIWQKFAGTLAIDPVAGWQPSVSRADTSGGTADRSSESKIRGQESATGRLS